MYTTCYIVIICFPASHHLKSKLPEVVRSYSGMFTINFTYSSTNTHCILPSFPPLSFSVHLDLSSGLEGGFGDVAIEVLHLLLSHLLQGSEEEVGVSKDSIETFVQTLRRDFPRERVPVVLAPLLYREQQDITEDRYAQLRCFFFSLWILSMC